MSILRNDLIINSDKTPLRHYRLCTLVVSAAHVILKLDGYRMVVYFSERIYDKDVN